MLALKQIITKLNTQQTTNGEQEMRNFIKDSVKYYLAVVQGMWMPVLIIAGMQYLGYEFYLSFNSLICGVLIGLSMMSIYLLAPTSEEEE